MLKLINNTTREEIKINPDDGDSLKLVRDLTIKWVYRLDSFEVINTVEEKTSVWNQK